MEMLGRISVDRDVNILVHNDSIHLARNALATKDYHAYFKTTMLEHDVQQLLGRVNTAEREEEATQNISKQFHSLASKIEDITKLMYQRLVRIYQYNQRIIHFLTQLRRVQPININASRLVEEIESLYSYSRTLPYEEQLRTGPSDLNRIPRIIDAYDEQVVEFKAALEKKLALMQAIDGKIREGFNELNAMVNASKAVSVLSHQETDSLHQLIGGTRALEDQLRRARRSARRTK